jgi:hypothetical protein
MNIRCFPNALKNSRRCRGVLDIKNTDGSHVAKTGFGNFHFTLNQDNIWCLVTNVSMGPQGGFKAQCFSFEKIGTTAISSNRP